MPLVDAARARSCGYDASPCVSSLFLFSSLSPDLPLSNCSCKLLLPSPSAGCVVTRLSFFFSLSHLPLLCSAIKSLLFRKFALPLLLLSLALLRLLPAAAARPRPVSISSSSNQAAGAPPPKDCARSFVRSFVCSLVRSLVGSLARWFARSLALVLLLPVIPPSLAPLHPLRSIGW